MLFRLLLNHLQVDSEHFLWLFARLARLSNTTIPIQKNSDWRISLAGSVSYLNSEGSSLFSTLFGQILRYDKIFVDKSWLIVRLETLS